VDVAARLSRPGRRAPPRGVGRSGPRGAQAAPRSIRS